MANPSLYITLQSNLRRLLTIGDKWHEVTISLADIIANFEALQISTLKDNTRENLISVENIHYTKAEANKNMQIYYSGFDFILGDETIAE